MPGTRTTTTKPNRRGRGSVFAVAGRGTLLFLFAACSAVPDWSDREFREFALTVHYGPSDAPRTVSIPSSTRDLTIHRLQASPQGVYETFLGGRRWLLLPVEVRDAKIECDFRALRRLDTDGNPLPWPRPEELFPDADRIVDRSGNRG